jgi:hypothetical protein
VEGYVEMLDDLLPVVVFETLGGLLLVDRYHRVALSAWGWRRSKPMFAAA